MPPDYYGKPGCCLTCEEAEPGCLCPACMCTKCVWYESNYDTFEPGGRCTYYDWKWEEREFPISIIAETDKGVLLYDPSDEKQAWFPKSQIKFKSSREEGLRVIMPIWLLLEKDWDF